MTTETTSYEGLTPSQMTKEQLLKYQSDRCKEYYQRNKEHVKLIASNYYYSNKDLVLDKAKQKARYDAIYIENRNRISSAYYHNNKDLVKAQQASVARIKRNVVNFVKANPFSPQNYIELLTTSFFICHRDKFKMMCLWLM